ncbi:hypothetical protein HY009_01830 [Candidatus Acetothermia bacterium]|nr:hypothetical protein [Candidatus Acetothermia bacterium]
MIARVYLAKSQYQEALEELQWATDHKRTAAEVLALEQEAAALRAIAYAQLGHKAEAQAALEELLAIPTYAGIPFAVVQPFQLVGRSYRIAAVYFALGERDQGFAWLARAYAEREGNLYWIKVDPLFDEVRSDPRFIELLKQWGLEK